MRIRIGNGLLLLNLLVLMLVAVIFFLPSNMLRIIFSAFISGLHLDFSHVPRAGRNRWPAPDRTEFRFKHCRGAAARSSAQLHPLGDKAGTGLILCCLIYPYYFSHRLVEGKAAGQPGTI